MLTESEKLDVLLRLSQELGQSKDLDILMEHILTEARRFVNADAGSIYLRDNGSLVFSYTQNDTLQQRLPPNEKLAYASFSIPIKNREYHQYTECGKATGDGPIPFQP